MKNRGLFLNMAKRCFCLFVFFQALMLLWFVFCVSGKVARVLKYACFPQFGGLCGVAYSCLFGFGRFRCFCVSCFCFSFCVGFDSVLFALFLFVVGLFLVLFLFLFCCFVLCFLFVFLFFGEGLRVR